MSPIRLVSCLACAACSVGPVLAQPALEQSAVGQPGNPKPALRSPFLPKGWGEQTASPVNQPTNTPLDQLEFRSMSSIVGQLLFSVFDPSNNRSYWLGLGESQGGYSLVSFDRSAETVTVRSSAGERQIPLRPTVPGGGGMSMGQIGMPNYTPAIPNMVTPLAPPMMQPPPPVNAAPMASSLPSGSFPIASGTPVPPGYILAQPVPSGVPGALPPGTTYAIPPGNPVPAGFIPVSLPGDPSMQNQMPSQVPPRRRIIVDPRSRQQPTR